MEERLSSRSPSSSPPVVQNFFPFHSRDESKENESVSVGEEIELTPDQSPSDDGHYKIRISNSGKSSYQHYTSSGSDQSPTSSNSDTQERTSRIIFKLFGKDPSDFPHTLRTQILEWLSYSPSDMESYIRPGCVILSVFASMPKAVWDQACKIEFCRSRRSLKAPKILSVRPIAVVAGEETRLILTGHNLMTPGTNFPVIVADSAICRELRSLEGDIDIPCEVIVTNKHSKMHSQDDVKISNQEDVVSFLNELGWLFQRNSYSEKKPPSPGGLPGRFKFLLTYAVERDWNALLKRILDIFFSMYAEEGSIQEALAVMSEIHLLHRAVKRNCRQIVDLLLCYLPLSSANGNFAFSPDCSTNSKSKASSYTSKGLLPTPSSPPQPSLVDTVTSPNEKIKPFYVTLLIASHKLNNCVIDSGASDIVMPAKVAHALGLTLTQTYGSYYSMESREVPLVGRIKYAQVAFVAFPEKEVLAIVFVADIPPSYGMFLSRNFCKYVGGEIQMDWSHALIPVNGKMRKLLPEKQTEYIVQKIDDPKAQILYEDIGHGNYMIMSQDEASLPKEVIPNSNGIWTLEFDGICSSASSGVSVVLISPEEKIHPFSFKLQFENTNNTAKYEAIIIGLNMAKEMGVKNLLSHGEAELIVKQVFNNDQHVLSFLELKDNFDQFYFEGSDNLPRECVSSHEEGVKEEMNQDGCIKLKIPKGQVILEELFDKHDRYIKSKTSKGARQFECEKVNIGSLEEPKMVNLGKCCT
ncbi:hypothetical protein KI387_025871 [Taxus chinensis]|uniref:RNase H type-1 domain-containing protein n=1 Tax=Taxus chinensis TaxID=29808 RepID=A0AA38KZH0_TAXCH|nr:hypothetical protein KI387_025871 [Taxus chinensis]